MSGHPIIACYRGLDSADAIGLAALLAGPLDEPLVLASAYRYEPMGLGSSALPAPGNDRRADAALGELQRARQFVPAGIEVREELVPATRITQALVGLARDLDASVLTVGRDTTGRVTRSLLSRAPCPIAVAPLSVPIPRSGPLRRIGVAYDGSTTAQAALVAAIHLTRAADAQLVLLSAAHTAERAAIWLDAARPAVGDDLEHESRPLIGDPASLLAEASCELDLLVCGTRGRGRALEAMLGSVSSHLLAHAQCPLLVVPPGVLRSRHQHV